MPLLHKILRHESRLAGKPFTFELWTNGPIDLEAVKYLEAYPPSQDYAVAWKNGAAMKPYVDKASSPAIRRAMGEHYFHHPLAKIAAKAEREGARGLAISERQQGILQETQIGQLEAGLPLRKG